MAISNPLGKGSRLSANADRHALFLFITAPPTCKESTVKINYGDRDKPIPLACPLGIGAEQFPGVGELGSPLPTEQAVDREISLNAVGKEQYRKVSDWFDAHTHQKILFLEHDVELRKGVIKHMLAQIANACEHTTYTVFNYSQAMAPDASCETILVDGDMAPAFARQPRAIRALCERAWQWPRAVVGARRGRNDPWHHHTPV